MMARLYPTKNAGLLDSFLEHKIENERLRRRIAELRREEEADADEAQKQWVQSHESMSDMQSEMRSDMTMGTSSTDGTIKPASSVAAPGGGQALGGVETPTPNMGLTQEALDATGSSRPDSLRDKMARYEGTSPAATVERLTGMRFPDGDHQSGAHMGPSIIRGDAGIAIAIDRDPRTGEKKKKLKTTDEYLCTDCGTLDSPEWRKGPKGPKSLCNACGLRWAKREKKNRNNSSSGPKSKPTLSTEESSRG
jgi:hypothetical protein